METPRFYRQKWGVEGSVQKLRVLDEFIIVPFNMIAFRFSIYCKIKVPVVP